MGHLFFSDSFCTLNDSKHLAAKVGTDLSSVQQKSKKKKKNMSRTFASLENNKIKQLSKRALQAGKHRNVERKCPRPATMPVCPQGKRCCICQETSCAEVQCALGFFYAMPAKLIYSLWVRLMTAWLGNKLVRQVICFMVAHLSSSTYFRKQIICFLFICFSKLATLQ